MKSLTDKDVIEKLKSIASLDDNVNYSEYEYIADVGFAIETVKEILEYLQPTLPPLTFVEAITRFRNS